jgi:hypothetical protein
MNYRHFSYKQKLLKPTTGWVPGGGIFTRRPPPGTHLTPPLPLPPQTSGALSPGPGTARRVKVQNPTDESGDKGGPASEIKGNSREGRDRGGGGGGGRGRGGSRDGRAGWEQGICLNFPPPGKYQKGL